MGGCSRNVINATWTNLWKQNYHSLMVFFLAFFPFAVNVISALLRRFSLNLGAWGIRVLSGTDVSVYV